MSERNGSVKEGGEQAREQTLRRAVDGVGEAAAMKGLVGRCVPRRRETRPPCNEDTPDARARHKRSRARKALAFGPGRRQLAIAGRWAKDLSLGELSAVSQSAEKARVDLPGGAEVAVRFIGGSLNVHQRTSVGCSHDIL